MSKKEEMLHAASDAEDQFDNFKLRTKQKLGLFGDIQVLPYRGYGNEHELWVKGRVLEESDLPTMKPHASKLRNLMTMLRRYETDEIPGAKVAIEFQGRVLEVETNNEGYFETRLRVEESAPLSRPWVTIRFKLLSSPASEEPGSWVDGKVLLPTEDASVGIISDMDDTVIKTGATDFLRHVTTVLFNDAFDRTAFAGVARFYQGLHQGPEGNDCNPLFYVSSSPWNIYDVFEKFLEINDIPLGPILLRDLGIEPDKFIKSGHIGYKTDVIADILNTYPALKFILIGDTGQKDAWVFQEVVKAYPDRVLAVYLRHVDDSPLLELLRIQNDLSARGIPMLMMQDSSEAARHAAANKWVSQQCADDVAAQVKQHSE